MEGQTIHDYYNDGYENSISGSNSNPVNGAVTAQNWWSTQDGGTSGNGEPTSRLDAQTFVLPATWGGTNLTSVTISDPSSNGGYDALSALQVDAITPASSNAPEPSSLLLLAGGMSTLLWKRLRTRWRLHKGRRDPSG